MYEPCNYNHFNFSFTRYSPVVSICSLMNHILEEECNIKFTAIFSRNQKSGVFGRDCVFRSLAIVLVKKKKNLSTKIWNLKRIKKIYHNFNEPTLMVRQGSWSLIQEAERSARSSPVCLHFPCYFILVTLIIYFVFVCLLSSLLPKCIRN